MKTLATLALLLLALPAAAQEITLDSVTWTIDPACPGTGADDTVEVTLAWSDLTPGGVFHVERGQQTTATSCPFFVQSWSVGFTESSGTTTFTVQETTEVHKAFRWRAIWSSGGSARVRDFLIEPPGGGDTCFEPPEAPDCSEPFLDIEDEPQIGDLGASWDLSGSDISVLSFDAEGESANRTDDPVAGTDTYVVAWPGDCPCSLVALVSHAADTQPFLIGNATPVAFWTRVETP